MANKKNGKVKGGQIRTNDAVLTEENYRKLQSQLAESIRNGDDLNNKVVVLDKSKKKWKIVAIAMTIVTIFSIGAAVYFGVQNSQNNDMDDDENCDCPYCLTPEDWIHVTKFNELQDKVNEYANDIMVLEEKVANFEITKTELEAEIASLKTNLEIAESSLAAAKAENAKIKKEHKEMKDQLEASNAKIKELEVQVTEYLERIEELEDQLDNMQNNNQGNQSGIIPGEQTGSNGNIPVGSVDNEDVNKNTSNKEKYDDDYELLD